MASLRIASDQPQRLVLTRGNSNGVGNIIGLIAFAVVACVGLSSFFDQGGAINPVSVIVALIVGLGLLNAAASSLRSTRVAIDGNTRTAERTDMFLFFPLARQQMSLNLLRDVVVAAPRNAAQAPASLPVWQVQLQGTDGSTLIVNERGTRGEMQALANKVGVILNRPVREESKAPASLAQGGVTGALFNALMNNVSTLAASSAPSNSPFSATPTMTNVSARLRQDDAERKRSRPTPPSPPPNTLSQDNAPMAQGNAVSVIQPTFDATLGGLNTPSVSYSAPPVLVLPELPGFTSFAPAMNMPTLLPIGSANAMPATDIAPVQEIKQVEISTPPAPNTLSGVASGSNVMNDATTAYRNALQAFAARNFGDALKAFERVLDLDPGNAAANNDLGILYFQQNKLRDAERAFRHTIALDPFSTPGRYNLGLTLNRSGRRAEAMEQFRVGARNAARGEETYFQNALQGNFQPPLPGKSG